MTLVIEVDVVDNILQIGTFGADTRVLYPNCPSELVEKRRLIFLETHNKTRYLVSFHRDAVFGHIWEELYRTLRCN